MPTTLDTQSSVAQDVSMKQTEQLPLPNPGDWYDTDQAVAALGIARATIFNMINDGRVRQYRVGTARIYWKHEIDTLATALAMVKPPAATDA